MGYASGLQYKPTPSSNKSKTFHWEPRYVGFRGQGAGQGDTQAYATFLQSSGVAQDASAQELRGSGLEDQDSLQDGEAFEYEALRVRSYWLLVSNTFQVAESQPKLPETVGLTNQKRFFLI